MGMIRIAHISDTHITNEGAFKGYAFDLIVEEINRGGNFDFVIHTGGTSPTRASARSTNRQPTSSRKSKSRSLFCRATTTLGTSGTSSLRTS